ncbi:hypothetical protein QBC36DRAFT_374902 [Triangularia setosa]|uniref:Uncharacterized protein n=1 Tax=Triangularia setosa TaxID=2587417 RepID=A0AAN6WHN0_9PEZI|nr:hypothetical protein QBC36DRAFT_374902 [Podospora setosa]
MPAPQNDEYQLMTFEEWSGYTDLVPGAPESNGEAYGPERRSRNLSYTLFRPEDAMKEVNPYPNSALISYQLGEKVGEFFNRCRPSEGVSMEFKWYHIRNPHSTQLPERDGDINAFLQEGEGIAACIGAKTAVNERDREGRKPLIKKFEAEVLDLARRHGVMDGYTQWVGGGEDSDASEEDTRG